MRLDSLESEGFLSQEGTVLLTFGVRAPTYFSMHDDEARYITQLEQVNRDQAARIAELEGFLVGGDSSSGGGGESDRQFFGEAPDGEHQSPLVDDAAAKEEEDEERRVFSRGSCTPPLDLYLTHTHADDDTEVCASDEDDQKMSTHTHMTHHHTDSSSLSDTLKLQYSAVLAVEADQALDSPVRSAALLRQKLDALEATAGAASLSPLPQSVDMGGFGVASDAGVTTTPPSALRVASDASSTRGMRSRSHSSSSIPSSSSPSPTPSPASFASQSARLLRANNWGLTRSQALLEEATPMLDAALDRKQKRETKDFTDALRLRESYVEDTEVDVDVGVVEGSVYLQPTPPGTEAETEAEAATGVDTDDHKGQYRSFAVFVPGDRAIGASVDPVEVAEAEDLSPQGIEQYEAVSPAREQNEHQLL